jgi:hypothetical protein
MLQAEIPGKKSGLRCNGTWSILSGLRVTPGSQHGLPGFLIRARVSARFYTFSTCCALRTASDLSCPGSTKKKEKTDEDSSYESAAQPCA